MTISLRESISDDERVVASQAVKTFLDSQAWGVVQEILRRTRENIALGLIRGGDAKDLDFARGQVAFLDQFEEDLRTIAAWEDELEASGRKAKWAQGADVDRGGNLAE